jgi:hypothetical protein
MDNVKDKKPDANVVIGEEAAPRATPILPLSAEALLRVALWRRAAARRLMQPVRKPVG